MATKKKKISELPLVSSLVGLYTLGVDNLNGSVKVGLEFIELAADRADASAVAASQKASAAEIAAVSAAQAASNAALKAALAEVKANEAGNAANAADEVVGVALAAIARMEELEEVLIGEYKLVPKELILDYPKVLTYGNKGIKKIHYTLLPANTGRNVLFLSDNNAVSVLPDGSFMILRIGASIIHAIPTENTSIYKTFQITVVAPGVRFASEGSLRLSASGNIRFT